MTRWIDNTLQERRVMLQQASFGENLPDYAIEKDWWVTMTLKALFQTKCKDFLEFKGGTSLSKGWQLIDRFSEDIDLALSHRYFGSVAENNTQLKNLRKKSRKYILTTLAEELEEQMTALGLSGFEVVPAAVDESGVPISSDADPTVIYVNYESIAEGQSEYVQPRVKVEISCLSMDEPFEMKTLGSIVSKYFPIEDEDSESTLPVVLPSRTFLEKAFLLNEEFQKDQPRSLRMTRHLYDLERIMDTDFGKEALADRMLYDKIVEHRRKFYHVGYADYDKDYPDRIEFLPPERCRTEWAADYALMVERFVYGEHLSFEKLLERIAELQERFRKLA